MNDIILKSNELIDSIKESELYKRYVYLKDKMSKDKEIMSLINEIKSLQKKLVLESNKGKDTSNIEKDINSNLDKLNNIPLYVEYDYAMKDLNNELQKIKSTIESCINDITN